MASHQHAGGRTGEALAGPRIGPYLHGPLLPRSPHLADYLLGHALDRHGAGSSRRSRTRPSGGRMPPSPRAGRRSRQRAAGPGSERSASGSAASSGSRRDADRSEGGSIASAHRHPVNQALIDRALLGANRRQGHRVHGQLTVHRHPDGDRPGLDQRQRRPSLPFRSLSVSSCGGLPARRGGTLPMGRSRTHRWPTAP